MSTTQHDEPNDHPVPSGVDTAVIDAAPTTQAEAIRFPPADPRPRPGAGRGSTGDSTTDRPGPDAVEASRVDPASPIDPGPIDRREPVGRQVLEGEIVRVGDPAAADRGDWLAGLVERV